VDCRGSVKRNVDGLVVEPFIAARSRGSRTTLSYPGGRFKSLGGLLF